jgi:hypothetical protein
LTLRSLQQGFTTSTRRRSIRPASELVESFRVLLASGSPDMTEKVGAVLESTPGCEPYVVETEVDARTTCRDKQPEVLLIDLLVHGSEAIALGIELGKLASNAQLVFLVEKGTDPELQVARDMGISRFVEMKDVLAWLAVALHPLAMLTRAQRQLHEARRAVDEIALWKPNTAAHEKDEGRLIPLAVGEGRYREAYLRAILARAGEGGRRTAARLAGVPYTTFCLMLRKLRISPPNER